VWVDRQGARLGPVTGLGNDMNPVLSPDDRKVAFERPRKDSTGSDIFVLDLGTGTASQLTFGAPAAQPVWSPDGSRITVVSRRSGGGGIFEKVASGAGSEELLLPLSADLRASPLYSVCDRSPDGQTLLEVTFPRIYLHAIMKGTKAIQLPGFHGGPDDCGQFS